MTPSRRSLIKLGGASLMAATLPKLAGAAPGSGVLPSLTPVDYGDVALLDGPARRQFADTHKTLLALDEDALLKPFRQKAGLPAPGPDFGGWYNDSPRFNPPGDLTGYIPGHSFGQHVSALARAYAVIGDAAIAAKVKRLVEGFAPTITPRFYDGYPLPSYTYDKTAIGLIDAHRFVHLPQALDLLNQATDAALPFLPERALNRAEMAERPHPNMSYLWDESYTLPENFYLAHRVGGGERFRVLARRFLMDATLFDPLAAGDNVLPGKHAYSHVNALSSAMQAYLTDGSAKHLRAAVNGFDFVLAQSYATGGWGPGERFITPGSGALGDSLLSMHESFETPCGAYGHFKIARALLAATGDSRYGDSMERVFYNTVLGALPAKADGTSFYYADYNRQGGKIYYDYACPCCFGTLGQVTADYGISCYLHDLHSVAINLYIPSRLTWRHRGDAVTIIQRTDYPLTSDIAITVRSESRRPFAIRLRIPAWAGPATQVTVNGEPLDASPRPGRFLDIARVWGPDDRIALRLDRTLRLEAVDDQHPNDLAVMHGPLALFATGERFLQLQREDLLAVRQRAPGSADYSVAVAGAEQLFRPYFAIASEPTRLYQPVSA